MKMTRLTRRQWLGGASIPLTGLLAGCSTGLPAPLGRSPTPTPNTYEYLTNVNVYRAPGVPLTLPAGTPEVDSPEAADLVILRATTDVPAETAFDWLAAGKGFVLIGDEAQSTYQRWMETESGSDPTPDMVAVFPHECTDRGDCSYSLYESVWSNELNDTTTSSGLPQAYMRRMLENALRDEATKTPVHTATHQH